MKKYFALACALSIVLTACTQEVEPQTQPSSSTVKQTSAPAPTADDIKALQSWSIAAFDMSKLLKQAGASWHESDCEPNQLSKEHVHCEALLDAFIDDIGSATKFWGDYRYSPEVAIPESISEFVDRGTVEQLNLKKGTGELVFNCPGDDCPITILAVERILADSTAYFESWPAN